MKYEYSVSLQALFEDICKRLFPHVVVEKVKCYRSVGENGGEICARGHFLNEIMQCALGVGPLYVLEFIRENFDSLPTEEKAKVMIHQILNISRDFGKGFRKETVLFKEVERAYLAYLDCRREDSSIDFLEEKN